jgi:hypothetical protein
MAKSTEDFRERMRATLADHHPFLGHPLLPIPLRDEKARTERVSSYVEIGLVKFLEGYKIRMGSRGISEAARRLMILGAMVEGYIFDGSLDEDFVSTGDGDAAT